MKTIGERIRKLRKIKKIDQTELSSILKISNETISRLELDRTKPKIEHIEKLSKIFEVSSDYILFGKESQNELTPEEQETLEILRKDEELSKTIKLAIEAKKKLIKMIKVDVIKNEELLSA